MKRKFKVLIGIPLTLYALILLIALDDGPLVWAAMVVGEYAEKRGWL